MDGWNRKILLIGIAAIALCMVGGLIVVNTFGYMLMEEKIADAQRDAKLGFGEIVDVPSERLPSSDFFGPKEKDLLQSRIKEHGPFVSYKVEKAYCQIFGNHASVEVTLRCKDEVFLDQWSYVRGRFLLPSSSADQRIR